MIPSSPRDHAPSHLDDLLWLLTSKTSIDINKIIKETERLTSK